MNAQQDIINQIAPNGTPDRDATQTMLTEQFVAALLLRGGSTPDEVVVSFGKQYAGVLKWLGDSRQDQILQAGMDQANVDLSHWLAEQGE